MTRFIDNKDGTVTDMSTNLMWQQSKGEKFTFDDAQKYASSLSLAGYNDWRLPTIEELKSLINRNKNNPVIDPVFECNQSFYRSSIIVNNSPNCAWSVHFLFGDCYWNYKDYKHFVRCVRDIKKED